MYMDGEESDSPKGTFEIYKAEADTLFKQGEYRKSIESYTTVRFFLLQLRFRVPTTLYTTVQYSIDNRL